MERKTQEQFIIQAQEIHGNQFDYSLVEYKNTRTKVKIICPNHGEFTQTPSSHLQGEGCGKCAGQNKTTQDIIAEFNEIHGDKYDYSKVEYKHSRTKVKIICPKHGEFTQRPGDHLRGQGCGKCAGKNKTTQDLIAEFISIHNDKYDYSLVEYKKDNIPVKIICPNHGEFPQRPSDHLQGNGCPKCVGQNKTTQDIIAEFRSINGDKYGYSLVKYKNAMTRVKIICPKHGEFPQRPHEHLRGNGCPKCVNKNETKTGEILTELLPNIRLERQKSWSKIFKTKSNKKS